MTFFATGCASGIGRVLADRLVEGGHRLVATDIDRDGLAHHADEAGWPSERVMIERLDVTSAEDWQRVFEAAVTRFGAVEVLYNVAGFLQPGYTHEFALEDIDRHFDINTKGVILGTRVAAEHMVSRGAGHVVNIASLAALTPVPGLALYSASKYAVRGFSLAAAMELADRGVAVTVVCPDAVDTPMLDKQVDYDEAALTFSGPRVLTAEEVVDHLTGVVLEERPFELGIPRHRKLMARLADLAPQIGHKMAPLLRRQGAANQAKKR